MPSLIRNISWKIIILFYFVIHEYIDPRHDSRFKVHNGVEMWTVQSTSLFIAVVSPAPIGLVLRGLFNTTQPNPGQVLAFLH